MNAVYYVRFNHLKLQLKRILFLPFQISSSSGRLQLVDATGSVDIMLNLPETWDFKRIFEVVQLNHFVCALCSKWDKVSLSLSNNVFGIFSDEGLQAHNGKHMP